MAHSNHELSKRGNVSCKISGMVTEDSWSHWSIKSLRPYLDTVVEAFGVKRLMAGSDWPVCLVATSYRRWWQILYHYFADYSEPERAKIFGATAAQNLQSEVKRTRMKAVVVQEPGKATLIEIPEPSQGQSDALLQVRMIGLCGTDLNTFRGKNPLVKFPRVLGHEVAATVLHPGFGLSDDLREGTAVTLAPYTACGQCASCLRDRPTPADPTRPSAYNATGPSPNVSRFPLKNYTGHNSLSKSFASSNL